MRGLVRDILDWLHPPTCLACLELAVGSGSFCSSCRELLAPNSISCCSGCGVPLPLGVNGTKLCLVCQSGKPMFDCIFILGPYEGLLRDLILRGKTGSGELLMESLGVLLAERNLEPLGKLAIRQKTWVTAIPSPFFRTFQRGHNPAVSLASGFGWKLGLPFAPGILKRARANPKQAYLSKAERLKNMRGAFRARVTRSHQGGTVFLVDDVTTTGATLLEACRELKAGGVGKVIPVVLAKTP